MHRKVLLFVEIFSVRTKQSFFFLTAHCFLLYLGQDKREDYLEDINEDYNDIRDEYYANLKQIRCLSINDARKKRWISEKENADINKRRYNYRL